jgi:hypothetical protein
VQHGSIVQAKFFEEQLKSRLIAEYIEIAVDFKMAEVAVAVLEGRPQLVDRFVYLANKRQATGEVVTHDAIVGQQARQLAIDSQRIIVQAFASEQFTLATQHIDERWRALENSPKELQIEIDLTA